MVVTSDLHSVEKTAGNLALMKAEKTVALKA